MAQAAEALTATRASETKLVAGVCFAHLVSHYYMLTLAPLFAFIRADFGVTYTELSLALTAFNVVSAVLQTPVGFFIDRTGARIKDLPLTPERVWRALAEKDKSEGG